MIGYLILAVVWLLSLVGAWGTGFIMARKNKEKLEFIVDQWKKGVKK